MRKAQLVDFVAKRRKQKKEQGREGSNFEESGGRGIREEATEIYSDPVHIVPRSPVMLHVVCRM